MYNFKIISNNPKDTLTIGKHIASLCSKNEILILTGDLGSGKTKFTEGFLSSFNLDNEISSPTFSIVNEYISNSQNIYHFDVYRLNNPYEFLEIGGDEYFKSGICIIEWGEMILDFIPQNHTKILFEKDSTNPDSRVLNIISNNSNFNPESFNNLFKLVDKI